MKWYHSLSNRLTGVLLLILTMVLCLDWLVIARLNSGIQQIDAVFGSNVSANELSDSLTGLQASVYEYLNTKSTKALESYYSSEEGYRQLIHSLNEIITDNEIRMLEYNIREMSETYLNTIDSAITAKRGRNIELYKEKFEEGSLLYGYIQTYIYQLNNLRFRQNSGNYQILLGAVRSMERISIFIMIALSSMGILLSGLMVRNMIDPLMTLSKAVHEVAGGNLDVPRLESHSKDEIGILADGFNQMVESLKEYIEKQRENLEMQASMQQRELLTENRLREAQLRYLQGQMNPHFLFNSLNAGMQLALLEDAERTSIFLEKMADFFRYNVQKIGRNVSLSEELETVEDYIYILNVRFAGDIRYSQDICCETGNVLMPSMILQPIVENSVNHGIHDCMDTGWIRLEAKKADGLIVIRIEDNGAGMTEKQLAEIKTRRTDLDPAGQAGDETGDQPHGIAIYNVIERMELYYNQSDLVTIESGGPGKGTLVTISIPTVL